MAKTPKQVNILGPTCTGKTSLALNIAKKTGACIVSVDSRQVVKHMDIGTGKLPVLQESIDVVRKKDAWELNGISVYGYDLVEPDQFYSAFDFSNYYQSIQSLLPNHLLVGGTGFYLDVLTGLVAIQGQGPDMVLRRTLERLATGELAALFLTLTKDSTSTVDLHNRARLIRAVEKLKRPVAESTAKQSPPNPADYRLVGLTAERSLLYQRADAWVNSVFGDALIQEALFIQEHFPMASRLNGLIYKNVMDYLHTACTLVEAKQRAKYGMHAYIRRQLTWFRKNSAIHWVNVGQKGFDSEVLSIVESNLHG